MSDHPGNQRFRPTVLLLYGGAAAILIAIHLATNGVLGFHTDELYYMASGRHPAFGYVDFPPVVPLLSRLETALLGVTPWALRVLPALLGGVNVILCGAYVRKLGGALPLQALALLIGVTEPFILGTFLFQTVIFDQVAWMLSIYWFLSIIIDRNPRTWILLGVTLGIGLEIKFLILALVAGMVLAVVLTPSLRAELRTKYPWIAVAVTAVIWAPNVVWQITNNLPTLAYVLNHQGSIQSGGGVGDFVVYFVVLLFLLTPLWVAGFISLFRNRDLRPIGIACAVPMVVYLFVGKYYYPAPTIPIVMAAGLLAMSRVNRTRLRAALAIGVVVASLVELVALMKITIPTTPASRLHATGLDTLDTDFAATVGWMSITESTDGDLCCASGVRTSVNHHRLVRLWGRRRTADLRQAWCTPGQLQPAIERLVLAAEARCRNGRAHGRLRSVRHRLDVYRGDDRCPSHCPVPRRQWRTGFSSNTLYAQ